MTKQELRQHIRALKAQHSDEALREMSADVIGHVLTLPEIKKARTVLAYASLPDEVDTSLLLDRLLADGRTVVLPKVTGSTTMELRRYTGRHDLTEGAYHIPEPTGPAFTDLQAVDTALIPGMAFTADGRRLGRGKGYYDRFLASLPHTTVRIGVCFPFQLVSDMPANSHDLPMDMVVGQQITADL